MKKAVLSYVHPLDLIGTITCPTIFIGSSVKPQYKSFVAWSTLLIFKCGSRNLSSWSTFFFKNFIGLAESTWIFICTKLSILNPTLNGFFNSFQSLSIIVVTINTE